MGSFDLKSEEKTQSNTKKRRKGFGGGKNMVFNPTRATAVSGGGTKA